MSDAQSSAVEAVAWMYTKDGEMPDILHLRPDHIDRGFLERNGWIETPLYAALTTPAPSDQAVIADLAGTLIMCRDQFDYYAAEHRRAEKHEKAATNERFAFLATQALNRALAATTPTLTAGEGGGDE